MNLEIELDSIKIDDSYIKNGRKCILDTFRAQLIVATPEELIRQKMAEYCCQYLNVPRECIRIEAPLCHYVKNAGGRADIIIHKVEGEYLRPIAVVECKNENVALTDFTNDQAIYYCDTLNVDYFILTNGIVAKACKYIEEDNQYVYLDHIPTYSEMLENQYVEAEPSTLLERPTLEQLQNQEFLEDFNSMGSPIFGDNTPSELHPIIVNLFCAFMDETHALPARQFKNFSVLNDIGFRTLEFGDAGGGTFVGEYRCIVVKDRRGNDQMLCFSLFGVGESTILDSPGTHRTMCTSLMVAANAFKTSKPVLEYNVDKYIQVSNNKAYFSHDGRMSRIKSARVTEYVLENAELLCSDDGRIVFGELPTDRLLYLDGEQEQMFMYALIEYSLLREEIRTIVLSGG